MKHSIVTRTILAVFTTVGCSTQSIPTLAKPSTMLIQLHACPSWGYSSARTVVVEGKKADSLHQLLVPTKKISVSAKVNELIATIQLSYPDGKCQLLYVRDCGQNPLAVSFDDTTYYEGNNTRRYLGIVEFLELLQPEIE